ncbi:MAG: long-chain-fatty-acid--CoA ligase [Pseudomonadota bacterium]
MDRIWLKNYPKGMPADVDVDQYSSVVHLLEDSFEKYRDETAYVMMDKSMTYGDIDRLSRDLGAYLQSLGLKKGDRVAIMMPNVMQYPITVAAVMRAGFVAVNVNPLYTPRELEHQLNDSGSKAIIIIENFANTLEQVIAKTDVKDVIVTGAGDLLGALKGNMVNFVVRKVKKAVPAYTLPGHMRYAAALKAGKSMTLVKPDISPKDICVLQYTGGTTGLSKGAVLLHETIISNLLSCEAWLEPGLNKDTVDGQITFICALPLYHVYAFISCMLMALRMGGKNVLIPNPRDLDGFVKTMGKYQFHLLPGVNTLFNMLINHPEFEKLDFSQLRLCTGGGMAVQEAVAAKWLEVTGVPLCEAYGLSETSSGITCNPVTNKDYNGTIGLPLPNVEVKILDDDGKEVPLGERGEVSIKGPQVMAGYWQNDAATAEVMTKDGFFKSGDIGVMDKDGYTKIVDRKKDMILVSGFNVYPNEVEAVAVGLDGVLEAACVGLPDAKGGEAVALFITKSNPDLTETAVREYCKENLTGYKRPKHIAFVDDLPKTNVGKILRRELRDNIDQYMNAA